MRTGGWNPFLKDLGGPLLKDWLFSTLIWRHVSQNRSVPLFSRSPFFPVLLTPLWKPSYWGCRLQGRGVGDWIQKVRLSCLIKCGCPRESLGSFVSEGVCGSSWFLMFASSHCNPSSRPQLSEISSRSPWLWGVLGRPTSKKSTLMFLVSKGSFNHGP